MRTFRTLLGLSVVVLLVAGCGGSSGGGSEGSSGQVRVAASISVIGDLTEEVAGDRAEVFTIVPAGADVHTFQPSPSDAQEISDAEVVFQNGLGLEEWMEDLVESASGGEARVVELGEGMETLGEGPSEETAHENEEHAAGEGHEEESPGADEHAHEHAAGNPHLWLDVHNAERYVEKIRDTLIEVDPEGSETYRANAEKYLVELEELDAYVAEKAASIPEDRRKLVTFPRRFPVLCRGLRVRVGGRYLAEPGG